jgi:hypothetical protein
MVSQDTPTHWAWREEGNVEIEGGKLQDTPVVTYDPQWSCKLVTSISILILLHFHKIERSSLPNVSQ